MHTLTGDQKTPLVYSTHYTWLIVRYSLHILCTSIPLLFSPYVLFAILQCVRAKDEDNGISRVTCHIASTDINVCIQ